MNKPMTKDEIMALVDTYAVKMMGVANYVKTKAHKVALANLSAALDEVLAERDAALEGWRCECSTEDACRFARERDAAIAERDALKADAERYRWLKTNSYVGIATYPQPHEVWCLRLPNPRGCNTLDWAVDSAKKGTS